MDADLAVLVLRVVVGGIVMQHGLLKLGLVGTGGSVKGVAGWFNGMRLRPGLFWTIVAIAAEAGGGILMVLGLGGPLGPALMAGDLVVVTIVAHVGQRFWAGGGKVGWEFPVPVAAAASRSRCWATEPGRWTASSGSRIRTHSAGSGSPSSRSAPAWHWRRRR